MTEKEQLVYKLAHLARLDYSPEEVVEAGEDLNKMIRFVEKLNELDTTGVEPLLHVSPAVNVLREDEVKGSIPTELALRESPQNDGRFFLVPKVIKNPSPQEANK